MIVVVSDGNATSFCKDEPDKKLRKYLGTEGKKTIGRTKDQTDC